MARDISTATRWALISKSDTVNIASGAPVALMCGATAGKVVIVDNLGNEADCQMAAGEVKPVQPVRVKSTGSDAINVYALYNN